METELSQEAEEYVEAIYKLQEASGVAKTSDLAKELRVVPGSVTNTIEHLKKHGLVQHEPYRGVKLTSEGKKMALGVLRRHRLAERLLTDILGGKWGEVHESACKLEHALTRSVTRLLEKRLGNPRYCPHGNPIPTEGGDVDMPECFRLTEVSPDEEFKIARLTDEKREKLASLAKKGIGPEASIHVVKRKRSGIVLRVGDRKCTLSYDDASNVWVKPKEESERAVQA